MSSVHQYSVVSSSSSSSSSSSPSSSGSSSPRTPPPRTSSPSPSSSPPPPPSHSPPPHLLPQPLLHLGREGGPQIAVVPPSPTLASVPGVGVEDGVVVSGSVGALVAAVVSGSVGGDAELEADFLVTYRYFVDPEALVEMLAGYFGQSAAWRVQVRAVALLGALLDADPHLFAYDAASVSAVSAVLAFVDAAFRCAAAPVVVDELRALARRAIHVAPSPRQAAYSPLLEALPPGAPLQMVLERLAPTAPLCRAAADAEAFLLAADMAVVAEQMTLISFGLYSRIEPIECIRSTFSDDPASAPAFTAWTAWTNRMRAWLVSAVLTARKSKTRTKVYAKLLELPLLLLQLQNFHDALNVWVALDVTPALTRLRSLRASLPPNALDRLAPLEILFDPRKNAQHYITALNRASPPLVPVLSIFSSLLFKTDGAQPDKLPSGDINFRKLRLMGRLIRTHLAFQTAPFYLNANPDVVAFLHSVPTVPESEWDALSVKIQKR